ncbi:MAG: type II secretion system secretin GspD [Pseudomonadota bacterium]
MTNHPNLLSFTAAVGLALLLAVVEPSRAQSGKLNLEDASLQSLVATVAEVTGKNFVLDPRVQEVTVNVISNRDMNPDEMYELFLSVLRVHEFSAVPAGDVIKIVPDAKGLRDAIPLVNNNPRGDQLVTQVIEVKHVPAAQLVPLLRQLIPQNGSVAAHEGSNVLVISDRAANVSRLAQIIRRIDTVSEDDVEVMALQHANAIEVVRALNTATAGSGANGAGGPKALADQRTNSVLLFGDPAVRLRYKTIVSHLDTPIESGGSTQVIYLRYASAESLVPILDSVVRGPEGDATDGPATIQAHAETNSLVITAPPAVFRTVQSVVRQLDVRRVQVQVEAIIAEVATDFARELGVQWQAASLDSLGDSGPIGGTGFPTNFGTGPDILDLTPTGENVFPNLSALGAGLNLGYLSGVIEVQTGVDADGIPIIQEIPRLNALVTALDSDADNNVLSTPSIVTLDHQEAVINVGQEVPFVTGQFTNTGANQAAVSPFQTITREDVGLTLTVTPHVNEGDTVILAIQQEVSSISAQSVAVDLITNKRELSTTVMVPDGGVLVLGGLIDDAVSERIQKVPALGDIPLLGNLFKYRTTQRTKRNLMVFIRPRILKDQATMDAVTGAKYNFMRDSQIEERQSYEGLLRAESLPLLPTLEEYREVQEAEPESSDQ